jgi:beta-lactamase regulating signal transducer with metallopeptidase domain
LLGYGAVLSWWAPRLLARVTGNGLSPRFSIAVWLCAIVMALGAWTVVGAGVGLDVVARGPHGPVDYCTRIVHQLTHLGLPGRVALAGLGVAAVAVSVVVIRRIVLALRRFWATSRDHAHDARLVGSPKASSDVVILRADQPAAYCVAGRPHAIVLTTGAIDALGEAELAAVLAHERAHLAGRHLQLMMLLRSLSAAMPRLPLFRNAVESVGHLVEMSADDRAARQHGRATVLDGLVTLAGQPRPVRGALGAADTAVVVRVIRLSGPVRRCARLRQRLLLAVTMAALIGTPVAASALCHL